MKGFKPTGYGPTSGFKFPASMGFTGSTGAYTNVQPYIRRMPFKDGGYVSKTVGDTGSALVRRARSYTAEDQESGGKSPLRPGFKKGGKAARKMHKANGGKVDRSGLSALGRMKKSTATKPPVATIAKEKFAADGGRIVRGSSAKPFMESVKDVPALVKSLAENATAGIKRSMYNRQRTVEGRNVSVGESVSEAETGKTTASNYSRGGKMKRMGYAKGGQVSRGEAKKIAERTVGEHVKYPAPKGHKGLGAMCK